MWGSFIGGKTDGAEGRQEDGWGERWKGGTVRLRTLMFGA